MKILIISDAWRPQTNGVVRTYENLEQPLTEAGHAIRMIGPGDFPFQMPMPGYNEIKLVMFPTHRLAKLVDAFAPDTVHIATEGPLGQAAWRLCRARGWPFTTCYHTQFPDYAAKRAATFIPALEDPTRAYFIGRLRQFHNAANAVMVATPSLETTLKGWGFTVPMHRLTRGVDAAVFTPDSKDLFAEQKRPVAIYVGRIALEKNLEAFLGMPWEGTKVLVGEGPDRLHLESQFPDAVFTGQKTGRDLASHYQSSDVFVFPSRTDTFGMVLVEALACGLPVAAYPVTGPVDIVTEPLLGALDEDLGRAALQALKSPGTKTDRHTYAITHYTWQVAARQFVEIIQQSGALIQR